MTEPVVDYGLRAGCNSRPDSWVEPADPLLLFAHTPDEGVLYAASGVTFFADVSEFEPVVDSSYPYPKFGFRADNGNRLDTNAAANWAYCDAHPDRIRVVIPYVVFKPGQTSAVLARLKNLFGSECPPQIIPEIDMESGVDFAGPGDHSVEANRFATELAQWAGAQARVQGYANAPDWRSCWPSAPPWMKKRLAYYSSNPTPPGYYSRQFYGALPYPSPAGYPRTCAPFGSYVDMNVTPRTITQIEADYGIGDAPVTPAEIDAIVAGVEGMLKRGGVLNDLNTQTTQLEQHFDPKLNAILANTNLDTTHPGVPTLGDVWRLAQADTTDTVHPWTNASIAAKLEAVQTQVEALAKAVAAIGTGAGGAVTAADVRGIINSTQLHNAG